ncbi:MAG: hypothetical protein KA170_02255 [Candidatus Promineofilum sp.]|nr:hypothetical protein [Promineifilum sp.]
MIRKIVVVWLIGLLLLAGCNTLEPTITEPTAEENDVTAITLITPESSAAYPEAGSQNPYPVSPVEALLPTGYPELTIVAPSGQVNPSQLTPGPSDGTLQVMPSPGRPNVTPFPVSEAVMTALVRHLSTQTDVPSDEIQLIDAQPMLWPNGGLGCPAEGVAYVEIQFEGMLITLEAGGEMFTYHTDGSHNFVLCRDGKRVSEGLVP